jgi:hypothetical protein
MLNRYRLARFVSKVLNPLRSLKTYPVKVDNDKMLINTDYWIFNPFVSSSTSPTNSRPAFFPVPE